MTDFLGVLIDGNVVPALTAFLLGIMTSISPCPLAANIAAIAFLSKNIKTAKNNLANGICYAIGRAASYTLLAVLIYYGFSSFKISDFVQGWGEKMLGPLLLFMGLAMLDIIKIRMFSGGERFEKIKFWMAGKGGLGAFLLGALFATAFCPYSAVLFFGVLVPLVLRSSGGLVLPFLFALGTGLPVIVFSIIIVFGFQKIGKAFGAARRMEKIVRYAAACVFLAAGAYYLCFLFGM